MGLKMRPRECGLVGSIKRHRFAPHFGNLQGTHPTQKIGNKLAGLCDAAGVYSNLSEFIHKRICK